MSSLETGNSVVVMQEEDVVSGSEQVRATSSRTHGTSQAVFMLVTQGRFFFTSASKFNIQPNGELFDVDPKKRPRVTQCQKNAFRRVETTEGGPNPHLTSQSIVELFKVGVCLTGDHCPWSNQGPLR